MRTLLTALVLALSAVGVVACGDDDEGGGGGPAVTFQKGQPVRVKGLEYKFEPGNVVVEGGGGATRLEFENGGALAHNLRLEQSGSDIGGSPTFQGGETKTSTVDLKPGEYELICTVGDHASMGMTGKLTVK